MHLVLSGEGKTDIGLFSYENGEFIPAPMYYIIDKIIAPNGDVIRRGGKKVVRRVITEDVAAQMRMMMESMMPP